VITTAKVPMGWRYDRLESSRRYAENALADPNKRLSTNVPGDFFVDATCINCDTCRQLAPDVFGERSDRSCVKDQPAGKADVRAATQALLACPTGSIGNMGKNIAREVMGDFPMFIDGDVYYCGFNSPKSFGGNSYFIKHDAGNWLVDAPKFLPQLVERFREFGGVSTIFLTHRDDVADADQYALEFGAKRIIHEEDATAQRDAEIKLTGYDTRTFGDDFVIIPTPGHTRGHCVLLYKNKYLFTGDHLAWERDQECLEAWEGVCWYDWGKQRQSLRRLEEFEFEWVLPGHGQRVNLPAGEMHSELEKLNAELGK
jgi:glyoxylase-like metal-dependent hydrolase (beta-lactamase superfamily II)/ferredoxin